MVNAERQTVRTHWRRAAAELGVTIEIPWDLRVGGTTFECDAFLPDFGGPNGIAVVAGYAAPHDPGASMLATRAGVTLSMMRVSPEYALTEFCKALIDWGYYGPASPAPRWLPWACSLPKQSDRRVVADRWISIVDGSRSPWLPLARELILEYGRSIADIAACSLEHQHFDDEIAGLPGLFAPPRGRLLVALSGGSLAGCIALRPLRGLGPDVCEMKRMYVRPLYRSLGVGRLLAERLIDEASAIGYRVLKLDSDTDQRFASAVSLYRSLGFVDCANYNDDPDPRTIWMEKGL